MKLRWISESFLSNKIRDALSSKNFFNHAMVQSDQPYQASTGMDNHSQPVTQSTGVPTKPRHRRYFGMERRLGTIRL